VDPEGGELADQKEAAFPNDPLIYETVRMKRSLSKAEQNMALEESRGTNDGFFSQVFKMLISEADPMPHGRLLYLSGEQFRMVERAYEKASTVLKAPSHDH